MSCGYLLKITELSQLEHFAFTFDPGYGAETLFVDTFIEELVVGCPELRVLKLRKNFIYLKNLLKI